jgi:hypothetical protein
MKGILAVKSIKSIFIEALRAVSVVELAAAE